MRKAINALTQLVRSRRFWSWLILLPVWFALFKGGFALLKCGFNGICALPRLVRTRKFWSWVILLPVWFALLKGGFALLRCGFNGICALPRLVRTKKFWSWVILLPVFAWLLRFGIACICAIPGLLRSRRFWVACGVMPIFLAILGTSVLRLCLYNIPMLRGDYATASQLQVMFPQTPPDDPAQMRGPMFYKPTVQEELLDGRIKGWQRNCDAAIGDRVESMFNGGWQLFQQARTTPPREDGRPGMWSAARTAFQKAYQACCDKKTGKVHEQYLQLASTMEVLIGLTFEHEEKLEDAEHCYERALDLDPNNIVAIYNNERLKEPTSSGGGAGADGKKPSQPKDPAPDIKKIRP